MMVAILQWAVTSTKKGYKSFNKTPFLLLILWNSSYEQIENRKITIIEENKKNGIMKPKN